MEETTINDQESPDAVKAQKLQHALHGAREDNKSLKSQLAELNTRFGEIEKAKVSKKESELVKQGKLEQLLEQKNQSINGYEETISNHLKTIEDMNSKVTQFNEYKTAQQAKAMDALAIKMEAFDESKRETLMSLVKDKPIEEQGAIIDQLISLQGTPDYKVNPKAGDKTITTENTDNFNKAKDTGDVFAMISNAPARQSI